MPETFAPADIVFGAALAFLFGVLVASSGWNIFFAFAIVLACGAAFALYSQKPRCVLALLIVLSAIFVFGVFYYYLYFNVRAAEEHIVFDQKLFFSGTILDEPKIFEKYQSLEIVLKPPFAGDIRVLASPLSGFHYGDLLQIEGIIESPRSIADMPTAAFPKIKVVARHKGFWLREKLIDLKTSLLSQFQRTLPAEEAALLGGITLGSQAGFTKEFKKQMALSGTTHLVALSGYNISILVLAVARVFGSFLSRRKTFYITTIIILLFVLMVGFGASVVRAAIMGFLALLAKEAGRIYSMRNAVVLTASGMAIVNPAVLTHDAGFQLSFVSLLGIVYLSRAIKQALRLDDEDILGLRETALMTLSAQLAVIPIIIQTFGQFSLTAILTNVLILEFVPLTMFLGFLLAVMSQLYFYFGFIVAKLAEVLLAYEIGVIKLFANVAIPITAPFSNSFAMSFAYYGALAAFIYYFSPRGAASSI